MVESRVLAVKRINKRACRVDKWSDKQVLTHRRDEGQIYRRLYSVAAMAPILVLEAESVERKTISIMKACELVGVSRRTIYNWLSSGKIEYVRTAGGSVRIFVDTLWRDPHHADRPATEAVWNQEQRNQA